MGKTKSNGYWKNWNNVEPILRKLMETNDGLIPSQRVFRERGLGVVPTILNLYHGGLHGARKKLRVDNLKKCKDCLMVLHIRNFRLKSPHKGKHVDNVCKPCSTQRVSDYRSTWPGRGAELFRRARDRAKKIGYRFDLDKKWILDQIEKNDYRCSATDIQMYADTRGTGLGFANRYCASLDRIDSTKGYTKDNVRVVCNRINIALGDLTDKQFEEFALGFLRKRGYEIGKI